MKKISSPLTFVSKLVFPVLWFGVVAFFALATTLSGDLKEHSTFLVIPLVMAVFGFFITRKLVWNLADEVYDCGSFLLIRNGGKEDSVPLSNIMKVSVSTHVKPPRITLRLIRPGKFGTKIVFSPATGLIVHPFAKSQVAEDLILRVHQERSKRAV